MNNISDLKNIIDSAALVLVGIGEEFKINSNEEDLLKAYNNLSSVLGDKNYFVVTVCEDDLIFKSTLDKTKITAPFCEGSEGDRIEGEEKDPQWEKYMMWLSCTLNKELLIIELGASIINPQIIRWPFEKTVELNNKAKFIRINKQMPNVPTEISEKSTSIKMKAVDFLIV